MLIYISRMLGKRVSWQGGLEGSLKINSDVTFTLKKRFLFSVVSLPLINYQHSISAHI